MAGTMKLTAADREAMVGILAGLYREILAIESAHRLVMGGSDLRPRIEYFHDAVRAFSSREHVAQPRLAVELLAYDLSCLRYLAASPLGQIRAVSAHSPSTELVPAGPRTRRPEREVRERLGELYQKYGLIFAALFKPVADMDFRDRTEEIDQEVTELAPVIAELERMAAGKGNAAQLARLLPQVHDEGAYQLIQYFLQQKHDKQREKILELIKLLKNRVDRKDEASAAIDAAHLQYAMNQLGIYEQGKDALKDMAAQGMNLAGRFVEASMTEARRGGRGR